MDVLEGLNAAQADAVQTTSGPVLILAGAGSGKTKTLTHRIAYLISHESIWPNEILAVTFTNKAAREMRERLGLLLHQDSSNRGFMPWMGTFHGICVRMLRIEGQAIGITHNFVIYDEDDRQGLVKQAMKSLSISDKEVKARSVSGVISAAKNEMIDPDEYESTAEFPYQKNIAKIYTTYEKMRKTAGALDFDDLLLETVRLFKEHKSIREKWQTTFKHILIDEYQDTNAAQYAIIKLLVNDSQNICVVGDDWQCLVEGTLIHTLDGLKKIETITKDTQVISASGYGSTAIFPIQAVKKFPYNNNVMSIKTKSGHIIKTTPNHLLFSKWGLTDNYVVYLMFSKGMGYRIGIVQGTRFDGKSYAPGIRVRANQERAERMWVLRTCKDKQEALYYEALYSYKYGIPMLLFRNSPSLSSPLKQSYINALFKEINTVERAQILMKDFSIIFDYPHFLSQATTRNGIKRININVVLFGDKRKTIKSNWSASRLSVNTTERKDLSEFERLGYTIRKGKAGTYRTEISNNDYGKIEDIIANLNTDNIETYSTTRRYAYITENPFSFMPASHIHVGMMVGTENKKGTITEDEVVSVKQEAYKGFVYDLDVDKVHNYIAGNIVVHNSIYSWRGADFTNILNFERDYPGAKVIKLEQNYRSTGNILNAAHNVITKNIQRSDKQLWTAEGLGTPVQIHPVYDEAEEAQLVADRISTHVAMGARRFDDFAVLYRTNAQSYTLERAFLRMRVPYQIIGGVRFYDRKEIKDIIAYLRLIYQPNDRMSFSRIVNVPTRGIGATSFEKFLTWQSTSGLDILNALTNVHEIRSLTPRAKTALGALGQKLRVVQAMVDTAMPSDLIEKLIDITGYRDFILDGTPQAEDREANLGSLLSDAQTFASLPDFLEEVALMSSADSSAGDEKVTLMTLHAAKGLEFPVVFMVGMEEGILPHSRVYEAGPAELEEERRLAYVGMTRARQELHLTYAQSRLQFGQRGYNPASRFLKDMGEEVAEVTQIEPHVVKTESDDFYPDELFVVGERIKSATFGIGEVVEVDGLALTIRFDNGQVKKLNAEYAHLEKVS
jgi:DNA helicase-2/ATP-dependent DNA helicase PcrA